MFGAFILVLYPHVLQKSLFLRASRAAPDDSLVQLNAAYCYSNIGDKKNAAVYFRKVVELNTDEKAVSAAKKQLKELRK